MSLIEEISNKIHKRHYVLENAKICLAEIKDELEQSLNKKDFNYEIHTSTKHESYEIEINSRKIEFTYQEIARKLSDQIEVNKKDIRNAMERIIFDKIKS